MSSCQNWRLCSRVKRILDRFTKYLCYGDKQTGDGAGYMLSLWRKFWRSGMCVCVMYFPPMFVERLTRLNKYCKAALINLVPTSKKYFELSRQKSGIATTTVEKKEKQLLAKKNTAHWFSLFLFCDCNFVRGRSNILHSGKGFCRETWTLKILFQRTELSEVAQL